MNNNWTYKKLGEVCNSDLGKTLNQSKDKGTLRPYLCAINILWDKVDLSILKQTKFEDSELERYSAKKGDLLICEGGDTGRAAIWISDEPILYQNALHRVRLNSECNARFVLYYLWYLKGNGDIDLKYSKGVTIKHLVKSSLLSIPIPIPSLSEQEAIVKELDLIHSIIDKKNEQLRELDKLAQSVFYTMFGDPIVNDKNWEIKKLGEVGTIIGGGTPKTDEKANWIGTNSWVTPAELKDKYIYKTERTISDEAARHLELMPIGTVLLSSRAPIGKLAITRIPMCCNQGFKNIVCGELLDSEFTYYYLFFNIPRLQDMGVGATFKEISKSSVQKFPIILPPLSLQQEFAKKVEAIEAQKELIRKSIAEVETLLASRMQYHFG